MRCRAGLLVILVVLAAGACSGAGGGAGAAATAACSAPAQEPLDPNSSIHLLAGAPDPTYLTDPPTSGAHRVGQLPRGVQDAPISRPAQVALLERGQIIVQYRPGVPTGPLTALAAHDVLVTVAPAPSLPAPVVLTAWVWKLRCQAYASGPVTAFIRAHEGRGPGTP